jgi:heme/copper-type cytochrome/quinol oxidase subunit 3
VVAVCEIACTHAMVVRAIRARILSPTAFFMQVCLHCHHVVLVLYVMLWVTFMKLL